MKWYRDLFAKSLTVSEKIKDIKERVKQLQSDFNKVLFTNVCRSLFEQHKLMFAFNMAIKLNEETTIERTEALGRKLNDLDTSQSHVSNGLGSSRL